MICIDYTTIPHREEEPWMAWDVLVPGSIHKAQKWDSDQDGSKTLPAAALLRVVTKFLVKKNGKSLPGSS